MTMSRDVIVSIGHNATLPRARLCAQDGRCTAGLTAVGRCADPRQHICGMRAPETKPPASTTSAVLVTPFSKLWFLCSSFQDLPMTKCTSFCGCDKARHADASRHAAIPSTRAPTHSYGGALEDTCRQRARGVARRSCCLDKREKLPHALALTLARSLLLPLSLRLTDYGWRLRQAQ